MSEALLIAFASPVATVFVQLLISWSNRKRDDVQRARRDQQLDDQLAVIEGKLDEHNRYAVRLGNIEKELTELKKDVEFIKEGAKK